MGSTRSILIIDDDPFFRALVEEALWSPGREVVSRSNGAQGIACLGREPPDLVLLDLSLPDIPGLEVLQHLRSGDGWDSTPIVMLTASDQLDDMLEAKRLGATGYLSKPIEPHTLATAVDELLGSVNLSWIDDITRAYRAR